jgi:hypothetical protein
MAEVTRKSRMAIVQESTEGTLVQPSSGADFLALQDGFSVVLAVDTLENAELKASIGKAQSITGFENPSASVSHYLRHSGTEGVAPQSGYSKLLKAAYGEEYVSGTEYDTIAASTTTLIKVDTGEGANFRVGQALLVKHAAFAWEIAVIKSISGDDLVPLFALQNAPATGTNLGKAVYYKPAESGHPTLSLFDYRGNAGALQAVAGARVSKMSVSASAGELLNASFDLEGVAGYFDPVFIASTDRYLDFTDDNGTFAAVVAAGSYKTPHHLAAALQAAMLLADPLETFTVVYSNSTGKFTIATSTSAVLTLKWNTGANTANTIGDKIGFLTAADDSAATTYTSDNAQDWSSPYTPAFDSPGAPLVVKNNRVMIGSQSDSSCFAAQSFSYDLTDVKVDQKSICAETGKAGSLISGREVAVSLSAILSRHQADLFYAMIQNTGISFQYSFGSKSGSNWEAGKSGCIHIKDASVQKHELGDTDGLVTIEIDISGFVDSNANPETGLNLL